jgi:hypothetical protein
MHSGSGRRQLSLRALPALAFAGALLAGLAGGTPAHAGPLLRGAVDARFERPDPAIRDQAFAEAAQAQTQVVRVGISWRDVNVTDAPPADATNPADPAYDFSAIDTAVRAASARGMQVMLMPISAPAWAEGSNRPAGVEAGTWKPSPSAFGEFGEALARRYSGSFSAGLPAPLPRVDYFEAWSEPNLPTLLTPQWRDSKPVGVEHYRRMLNAFYNSVHAVNSEAKVIAPGTAPYGDDPPNASRTRPVVFLRRLLCLRETEAGKLAKTECSAPARFDVLSHHPLNTLDGPRVSAGDPDDATTPDFDKLIRIARVANRKGTLLPRLPNRPAWATEFWFFSNPPNTHIGFPMRTLKRWVPLSLYVLWKQGVDVVIWWQLTDRVSSQTGLFFSDGRQKPILRGWRFPFVTNRRSKSKVLAWTIPPASGELKIQRKTGSGWRVVKRVRAREGRPLQTQLSPRGEPTFRATVGGERSLPWQQKG